MTTGQRDALVQVHELHEREESASGTPSISMAPARWQRANAAAPIRGRARGSRRSTAGARASPGPRRRAASPARRTSTTSRRRRRRGSRHHRVDRDPPAGDRDLRLAGRHEDGLEPPAPRLEIELDRDGLLPIAQSDPTVSTIFASTSRSRPLARSAGRRSAQVSQLDTVPYARSISSASSGDELVGRSRRRGSRSSS